MRKNPTLGFLRTQKSDGGRINCPVRDAIYALGIGSDLASPAPGGKGASPAPGGTGPPASPAPGGTGWRPSRGQPVPPGAGETPRPARGGGRHPHGSDSASEPTPPIYIRGGATIPYIYKGIVRSHSKKFRRSPSRVPYIWDP